MQPTYRSQSGYRPTSLSEWLTIRPKSRTRRKRRPCPLFGCGQLSVYEGRGALCRAPLFVTSTMRNRAFPAIIFA